MARDQEPKPEVRLASFDKVWEQECEFTQMWMRMIANAHEERSSLSA